MKKKILKVKKPSKTLKKESESSNPSPKPQATLSQLSQGDEKWESSSQDQTTNNQSPVTAVPFDQIVKTMEASAPPKRGPGRPPKGSVKAAVGSSPTSTNPAPSGSPLNSKGEPDAFNSVGAPAVFTPKSSGIPPELIRNGLELPFALAAAKTGFPGFALAKEESDPLVPQADHLLATYLPNLGPNGPLYMFSVSVVALASVKYMMYQDWKITKPVKKNETTS